MATRIVDEYAEEFFFLMTRNEINDSEIQRVSHFIWGLNPQLQYSLAQFDPTTISEAHHRAVVFEQQIRSSSGNWNPSARYHGFHQKNRVMVKAHEQIIQRQPQWLLIQYHLLGYWRVQKNKHFDVLLDHLHFVVSPRVNQDTWKQGVPTKLEGDFYLKKMIQSMILITKTMRRLTWQTTPNRELIWDLL